MGSFPPSLHKSHSFFSFCLFPSYFLSSVFSSSASSQFCVHFKTHNVSDHSITGHFLFKKLSMFPISLMLFHVFRVYAHLISVFCFKCVQISCTVGWMRSPVKLPVEIQAVFSVQSRSGSPSRSQHTTGPSESSCCTGRTPVTHK